MHTFTSTYTCLCLVSHNSLLPLSLIQATKILNFNRNKEFMPNNGESACIKVTFRVKDEWQANPKVPELPMVFTISLRVVLRFPASSDYRSLIALLNLDAKCLKRTHLVWGPKSSKEGIPCGCMVAQASPTWVTIGHDLRSIGHDLRSKESITKVQN